MSMINKLSKCIVVMLMALTVVAFMPAVSGNGSVSAATEYYNVYVGNIQVTSANMHDIDGTGSISYNPLSRTLTMDDYTYTGAGAKHIWNGYEYRAAIISFGELSIQVKGSANINLTNGSSNDPAIVAGIAVINNHSDTGNLYVSGGKLSVSASSNSTNMTTLCGIYTQGGLDAYGTTINAKASNTTVVREAIGMVIGDSTNSTDFTMTKATINATGGYAANPSSPYAANFVSMGIRSGSSIYVDNNSTLTAKSGEGGTTIGMQVFNFDASCGLYVGYGTLTAIASEPKSTYGESSGIYTDVFMIESNSSKIKVVGHRSALSTAPELDGASLYVKYSSNVDGSESGASTYYAGKYYDSSAVREEIVNGVHYFETFENEIKNLANCKVDKISDVPYAAGYAVKPDVVKVWDGDKLLVEGQDYVLSYSNNKNIGVGKVIITGYIGYTGQIEAGFNIVDFGDEIDRIAGQTRFETSLKAADKLLELKGESSFDNIIVACGSNFPDALAGSYLAKVKNAPIILVGDTVEADIINYIENKFSGRGKVYILGGTGAVSKSFTDKLKSKDIAVKRLDGTNRYQTNIKILKAAGVDSEELLICTGTGYADSLSASAVGRPVLLVGSSLDAEQKAYLQSINPKKLYVVGGTGAVNNAVVKEVEKYTGGLKATRLAGQSRFETSTLVASTFFSKPKAIVLAYAQNFPDGLSGGPIAMQVGAPLVLVTNDNVDAADNYASGKLFRKAYVLGGVSLISDQTAARLLPRG